MIMVCPLCEGSITIDTTAETESTIWHKQNAKEGILMPYVEVIRRSCIVAFCDACEYALELDPEKV